MLSRPALVTALLGLALACFAVSCSGDEPAEAASEEAAPSEDGAAASEPEASSESSEADAAPSAAPATGAARVLGDWTLHLGEAEMAELEAARAALAANPDDSMAKGMVDMMEAMLASMTLVITDTEMTMTMADETQTIPYSVVSGEGESVVFESTGPQGQKETITANFSEAGVMVWTKDGESKPLSWARKQ